MEAVKFSQTPSSMIFTDVARLLEIGVALLDEAGRAYGAEHVIVFAHAGHWLPQLLYK